MSVQQRDVVTTSKYLTEQDITDLRMLADSPAFDAVLSATTEGAS